MRRQPRAKPYSTTKFFPDNQTARPLVADTVAQGYVEQNQLFLRGTQTGDQLTSAMPFPLTAQFMQRGQVRYNIYCSPCHSRVGEGDGMIVRRGFTRPPSYFEDRLLTAPLGHFVNVMTGGFGRMPDYSLQVPPADRWAIAAYIRALQYSRTANVKDLSAQEQQKLMSQPQEGAPRR